MNNGHDGNRIERAGGEVGQAIRISSRSPLAPPAFTSLIPAACLLLFAPKIEALAQDYFVGSAWVEHVSLLIIAAAAWLTLRGALAAITRTRIDIVNQTVTVSRTPRLWRRNWSEPLANYEGVRWTRSVDVIGHRQDAGSTKRQRYRHVIELAHADTGKTVPLFVTVTGQRSIWDALGMLWQSRATSGTSAARRTEGDAGAQRPRDWAAGDDPRSQWESLAHTLGLPAIDARDGAHEVREAADLDKSLKQRWEEGKVEANWEDTPPPATLQLEHRGDPDDADSQKLRVTIHASFVPNFFLFMLSGFGVVTFVGGLLSLSGGGIVGGLLLGGAAFGIWYLHRRNPHQLTITRKELRYHDPLVVRRSFVMPLSEIESVTIRERNTRADTSKTLKLSGKQLLISSDKQERTAGGGLNDEELQWLKNYITAAVAKA